MNQSEGDESVDVMVQYGTQKEPHSWTLRLGLAFAKLHHSTIWFEKNPVVLNNKRYTRRSTQTSDCDAHTRNEAPATTTIHHQTATFEHTVGEKMTMMTMMMMTMIIIMMAMIIMIYNVYAASNTILVETWT